MTVAAALQRAALRVAGYKPDSFYGSTQSLEIELADLANEVADDIWQYQEWQVLKKIATVLPVETQDLPNDYGRMLQSTVIQDTNAWLWGYFAYDDMNQFMYDRDHGAIALPGGWILYGNQLHFAPTPAGEARYPYLSKNWAQSVNGTPKDEFDNDNDVFLLPERLLTLGVVWRWRENKKLDAAGDQEAFIKALDEYAAKDRGARVYRRNSKRVFGNARPAWPWTLG